MKARTWLILPRPAWNQSPPKQRAKRNSICVQDHGLLHGRADILVGLKFKGGIELDAGKHLLEVFRGILLDRVPPAHDRIIRTGRQNEIPSYILGA